MMKAYYSRFRHTFGLAAASDVVRVKRAKVSSHAGGDVRVGARSVVLGALAIVTVGCNKSAPNQKSSQQPATSAVTVETSSSPVTSVAERPAAPAHGAPGATELAITWSDPPEWERVTPKSRMRLAQYVVKPVGGDTEAGEVTLFHFGPNMGGGVEENITRWTGQFSGVDPKTIKRTTKTNGNLSHHLVQIESGQFQSSPMMGGPAEPKPNYGLLGAVTEAPSGKYFFKLTGPSKTVAANLGAFEKLIDSIKTK